MMAVVCAVMSDTVSAHKEPEEFLVLARGGLERLLRVLGYVFAASYKWKKRKGPRGPGACDHQCNGRGKRSERIPLKGLLSGG